MSLEQAITDHASALRELAAAIRSTISGAHDITAATDKVISDAKKGDAATASSANGAKPQTTGQKESAPGGDGKKPADTPTAGTTAKAGTATASPSDAPQVDYEAVKAKVLALSKAKGREPTVALLQRYGVEKAPELKEEQYADFVADAERVIGGTYDPVAAAVD